MKLRAILAGAAAGALVALTPVLVALLRCQFCRGTGWIADPHRMHLCSECGGRGWRR